MARCLYNSDFATFLYTDSASSIACVIKIFAMRLQKHVPRF